VPKHPVTGGQQIALRKEAVDLNAFQGFQGSSPDTDAPAERKYETSRGTALPPTRFGGAGPLQDGKACKGDIEPHGCSGREPEGPL
jgi:hypothetical protein